MVGTAVGVALLVPATVAVGGPAVVAALGRLPRRRTPPRQITPVVVVLIPAHDEATTLPATLRSLAAQDYPAGRVRVVVVADNCADATTAVAVAHGAAVVERTDPARRGKGYALAAGLDAIRGDDFDAVFILDADCTLNPTALREAAATLERAEVAQAAVRSRNADDGPAGFVAAVGAAVDAAVAAGRERLGGAARLRGTGMAFRRGVLDRVTWATASPVEDAEYEAQLRAAGVRVRYCEAAEVTAAAPAALDDLYRQRRRWAAAGPTTSKPLALLLVAAALTACAATGELLPWGFALAAPTAALYGAAAWSVGLTRRRVGSLLAVPAVVARLAGVAVTGWLKPARGWAG
jgi:cellulose synthase/poly-beta-1,6-N-acetylglucosamine synthase-like glycosyltransferase